jgi:hypothetical protein
MSEKPAHQISFSSSKESLKEDFSTADPRDLTSVGKADASNAAERVQPSQNSSTPRFA